MQALQSETPETISRALVEDPRTQDVSIEVAYQNGIVTLSGPVRSLEISQWAEEIAREQPGVIIVINEIRVAEKLI